MGKQKKVTEQKLPKWFDGVLYTDGDIVRNPLSGAEIELTNVELSMYDFIMGCQLAGGAGVISRRLNTQFRKGLDWFIKNNIQAYMVLLD
jgi:hypothetical protein